MPDLLYENDDHDQTMIEHVDPILHFKSIESSDEE